MRAAILQRRSKVAWDMSVADTSMDAPRQVPSGAPGPDEIIARARTLIPTLAKRSREGRRQRRVPDETIADMQGAGFFRVLQPRRWGGYEMDLHTFYEVQLALAEGDMSTAWIYGVSGVHPWFMALLDDRAAHEVWGNDSSTLICSSLMPAGKATSTEGGFRLSGRWRYASCCDHCDWALLGALVDAGDGGPPQGRVFLVPRRDYQSVDTWQVSGLQATGSWDVIVDDVLVPAHRTQSMLDNFLLRGPGQTLNTSSLYRLPFGQIFVRGISTPALEERLRYKFQSTAVTERCTLLAARIFKATGAAGLSEDLPFGGIFADLMAGRQHISNQYEYVGSSWGGVMFGLENKDLMI